MKDYSCGKCGKTHVCIGIPSLYRSLLTPSVIPKYNAILHCWFDTYTHDLLTLRHPNQIPATGSQQTAEHPKVAPGARLSAQGKSSAHPFSCNQSDVLIKPNHLLLTVSWIYCSGSSKKPQTGHQHAK